MVVWEVRARQATGDLHGDAGLERSSTGAELGKEPEVTVDFLCRSAPQTLELSPLIQRYILFFFFFPKKILLEMTFFAVTKGYLHSITHLPLPRCGKKIIHSAQKRSWMPTPASPLPGLMRRYQERL